ncbi:winged helix-turn-helix transcriptional regulator [Nocardioides alkalitolerans]|uniref:winged helix-turn-helix transcriptional regulator n=1 Tax=Nocardioides alkalitolerans TaxID=281714 RepID=UPI000411542A|nr:helix-turn-helix domain-containing protein [Nocardioides alkalitolerans]
MDRADTARMQLDTACPQMRQLVEHVTSKWGLLVLLTLADGTLRWSELKRSIAGVSEKMLIQTLQTLEADGLVRREARPVVPPHVEYSLTPAGQEARDQLAPLVGWAQDRVRAQTAATV